MIMARNDCDKADGSVPDLIDNRSCPTVRGSQKSLFPSDDLSRPCRPKASQGLLIIMMIAMMIMIVMMVILMIMMKNYQKRIQIL